ncbi:uncharacterized protein PRCAT00000441001 [Priceomyces carsonii]|uniref:uncharacterized protein n=1 Tax=Priceomyces carsonii TaxID=28549 RepID=UPI002ED9BE51|nr:unnamed protein product [Priceomyces carsonii]
MKVKYFDFVIYNTLFRSKRFLTLIIFATVLLLLTSKFTSNVETIQNSDQKKFDILSERSNFRNLIYSKWDNGVINQVQSRNFNKKCHAYFSGLDKLYSHSPYIFDIEEILRQEFNNLIYKEPKWLRNEIKKQRRELLKQGLRLTKEQEQQIRAQYEADLKSTSLLEERLFLEFSHMRVFGKCFLDSKQEGVSDDGDFCLTYARKLYPWLAGNYPIFENWKRGILKDGRYPHHVDKEFSQDSSCFLSNLISKSNGKGIVIPIYPSDYKSHQIRNIRNLIKVLRALKNDLPIEITYMRGDLNENDKSALISEARTEISSFPDSFGLYFQLKYGRDISNQFISSNDYPKQDLWFADLSTVKNSKQHPMVSKSYLFNSPSFILSLSLIFNSFEDIIVLDSDAIPLLENFGSSLFQNEDYQKHGTLFFKNPSYTSSKPRIFNPGYFEVESFITLLLMPSSSDEKYFGISRRSGVGAASNRVFVDHFFRLMDPSLMVIKKSKTLSGLLVSCNFQLYPLLTARFAMAKSSLDPDFIWLGQEISGAQEEVVFNKNYGVAAGIFTPEQNKPKYVTESKEICSSSWAQLYDKDDLTLLYVTNHQLQNWVDNELEFRRDLEKKYSIMIENNSGFREEEGVGNRELYADTIEQNPLFIDSVIKPPVIKTPIHNTEFNEPSKGWIEFDEFGGEDGTSYWCAYDVVGSPQENKNSAKFTYNALARAKFRYILDVWLQEFN